MSLPEYDYKAYFEHGMTPSDHEVAYRDEINRELPPAIIDSHVHAAEGEGFEISRVSNFAWNHMVSTFPETTIEQSGSIDRLMLPGLNISKLRFAHAFAGVDHAAANLYLTSNSPESDRVALFGLSDSQDDIEYTIQELKTGKYTGLKMYYMASQEPKSELFDYFPPAVLSEAEKQGVPIILHFPNTVSRSLSELDELASTYPKLEVVLAHVGVTWFADESIDRVLGKVAQYERVSVDTSGVTEKEVVLKALQHLGRSRVLYGSDEPYNILREFSYDNPDLGPRILCDYPYHWVDSDEYAKYNHLAPPNLVYSQFQQVDALLGAIDEVAVSPQDADDIKQRVFHDNAKGRFGF